MYLKEDFMTFSFVEKGCGRAWDVDLGADRERVRDLNANAVQLQLVFEDIGLLTRNL